MRKCWSCPLQCNDNRRFCDSCHAAKAAKKKPSGHFCAYCGVTWMQGTSRKCETCSVIPTDNPLSKPKYKRLKDEELKWKRYEALYGLTKEHWEFLFRCQGQRCAICGDTDRQWFVDHSHVTGKVRGILCPSCNTAIGLLLDSPKILRIAADYVENRGKVGLLG